MPQEPTRPEAPSAQDPAEDELLIDGQEKVFARSEVERGAIEHHSLEEDAPDKPPRQSRTELDQQMAENFRAQFNPRP